MNSYLHIHEYVAISKGKYKNQSKSKLIKNKIVNCEGENKDIASKGYSSKMEKKWNVMIVILLIYELVVELIDKIN